MFEDLMSKRRAFLDFFTDRPVQYASDNVTKPYLGALSPGCVTCINGTWSCLYLNSPCTRNCFYCPQDKRKELLPRPHDIAMEFHDISGYIRYLDTFPFEGIGISGGEPFLDFVRITDYIREIRHAYGSKHYIWVYTNGDLVTEERLGILSDLGLDEIRFDLSAREYDLTPVELAVKYIDTVTIEIPAIPEDIESVKGLLGQFERLGVKHLNLHELMATEYNQNRLADRGYSFCKSYYRRYVPESELAAFEIMKHAIESNSGLGINYCSLQYKEMFQTMATRKRYAPLCRKEEESVSGTGFIRRFSFEDSPEDTIPVDHLERAIMAEPYRPIRVVYYHPKPKVLKEESADASNVLSFGSSRVTIAPARYSYFTFPNRASAIMFHALFLADKDSDMRGLMRTDEAQSRATLGFIRLFRRQFGNLEYIPEELLDYEPCKPA